jgi:hypothetical protein
MIIVYGTPPTRSMCVVWTGARSTRSRCSSASRPRWRHPYAKAPTSGDAFTAAHISCGFAVGLARFLGFDDRLDATLKDYAARLAQRPAFQKALAAQPQSH